MLTVSASVIGLVLGMALAVAGISPSRWLRWPARVYTDIFRGLPEVVIILLIGLGVGPVVGGLTGNNPYPFGIGALGLMAAGAACVDEPVHLAVEGVVVGVFPWAGGQSAGAVPSWPRSQCANRKSVDTGGGGALLSAADGSTDAPGQLDRRAAAAWPRTRSGRPARAVHVPGDDLMADPASLAVEPVSLSATDIHLAFGPNAVLRGVDIDVPAGTTAAVIGPSGSGKSTLLRTLNRLYEPDKGYILLDGQSVLANNPDQLRQRIGMVFQNFNLFPHRSVLDNVTLAPRKLKRLGAEQARESGVEQLDRVGLRHKADVRPGTLLGGQQQRVAIARALAMSPQVMFFDEATSALDPELVKGILALIADLGADGMTMVVVTHEMGFARSTSDAVVFMDHGQVVESGPPEQIFETAETDRLRRFLSQVLWG